MTTTIINRIDDFRLRLQQHKRKGKHERSADRREYVHFCAGSQDGTHSGCGHYMNCSVVEDFMAHCPNCSESDYDSRVFKFYGDPLEYERSARSDWIGGLVALLFAVLAAAILVATLFV